MPGPYSEEVLRTMRHSNDTQLPVKFAIAARQAAGVPASMAEMF